jgi:hypothetical protein
VHQERKISESRDQHSSSAESPTPGSSFLTVDSLPGALPETSWAVESERKACNKKPKTEVRQDVEFIIKYQRLTETSPIATATAEIDEVVLRVIGAILLERDVKSEESSDTQNVTNITNHCSILNPTLKTTLIKPRRTFYI